MKAVLFEFPPSVTRSFHVELDEGPFFYVPLHFHLHLQLTLILESKGTRFVGDSIGHFEAGDLVLIGSNVPHAFRNDPTHYEEGSTRMARAISAFFLPDFLGHKFQDLPEAEPLSKLIEAAGRGILVTGETRKRVSPMMEELVDKKGFPRLLHFCQILYEIAISPDLEILVQHETPRNLTQTDSGKLNRVLNHVMQNFHEEVKLDHVSTLANMRPTAFCRYFKRSTRKTFGQFLTEVRVSHACKLLREGNFSITQIAYQCGFNNMSNFNRRFKAITEMTPRSYMQAHR